MEIDEAKERERCSAYLQAHPEFADYFSFERGWLACAREKAEEVERLLRESKADFNATEDQLAEKDREVERLRAIVDYLSPDEIKQASVRRAKATKTCRICGGEFSVPWMLDYGKEFAHVECVMREAAQAAGGKA